MKEFRFGFRPPQSDVPGVTDGVRQSATTKMPGAQRTGEGYFVYTPSSGDFPATYETHWDAFKWWWTFSMFGCFAVVILSRVLLPYLLPASWEAMVKESPWKAVSVPKNVAEWWPAFVVAPLAWRPCRILTEAALAEPAMALYLPAPFHMWCATGAAVGYMTFDCVLLLVFRQAMISSMKLPMYLQIWGHHILSMLIWPIGLHTNIATVFISWFLLSEGSNIFLNCRTLLIKFNAGHGAKFAAANALFSLSFLVLRILPIPLFLTFWYGFDWSHTTWFTLAMAASSTPLPVLLNLYWFSLMLSMVSPSKKKLIKEKP